MWVWWWRGDAAPPALTTLSRGPSPSKRGLDEPTEACAGLPVALPERAGLTPGEGGAMVMPALRSCCTMVSGSLWAKLLTAKRDLGAPTAAAAVSVAVGAAEAASAGAMTVITVKRDEPATVAFAGAAAEGVETGTAALVVGVVAASVVTAKRDFFSVGPTELMPGPAEDGARSVCVGTGPCRVTTWKRERVWGVEGVPAVAVVDEVAGEKACACVGVVGEEGECVGECGGSELRFAGESVRTVKREWGTLRLFVPLPLPESVAGSGAEWLCSSGEASSADTLSCSVAAVAWEPERARAATEAEVKGAGAAPTLVTVNRDLG
jgi:hypothetical protein